MADPKITADGILDNVIKAVILAAIIGAFTWIWSVQAQINKLDDWNRTKEKHWRIHSQTRDYLNEEFEKLESAEYRHKTFKWDLGD